MNKFYNIVIKVDKKNPSLTILSQTAAGVYTNVANQMGWIRAKIKANGGMASCAVKITSSPTLGNM